jgi:hypothetical protein
MQLPFVSDKSRQHFVHYKLLSLSAIGPPLLNSLPILPMVLLPTWVGGGEGGSVCVCVWVGGGGLFLFTIYLSAAARHASSRILRLPATLLRAFLIIALDMLLRNSYQLVYVELLGVLCSTAHLLLGLIVFLQF